MLVLALDTSLKACSLAICADGKMLADMHERLEKGHAERIAPMAVEALAAAGVTVKDLDRVGVVVGPGAFAGVRVGLAFARGLAIGTKLDVVGVTSLEALAAATPGARSGRPRAAVIDARRGQVYAALYDEALNVRVPPFVAAPEAAAARLLAAGSGPIVVTGDGATLLPAADAFETADAAHDIDAKAVARLAAEAPHPEGPPAPLYLRPPDARPARPSRFAGLIGGKA